MQVISRADARNKGSKRYYTGAPCKGGHITERYVSTGACVECARLRKLDWLSKNSSKSNEYARRWRRENQDRVSKYNRMYRDENRCRLRERDQERYASDPEAALARNRQWHELNREHVRVRNRRRYREDSDFRLTKSLRCMVKTLIKRGAESKGSTFEAVGYTAADLKAHIEKQFFRGMSWDNYGEWHIDHIIPIAEHLRNGETDPSVINCLTNLRPMWAEDNMSKGDKRTQLL